MVNELILCWKHPVSKKWLSVGRLRHTLQGYEFAYENEGASKLGVFAPFGSSDLGKVYVSEQLFPLFKNRLLTKSRPEYKEYLEWLGLDVSTTSDMEELARSGGGRVTDSLQVLPYPKGEDGRYRVRFFAHGLRHISQQSGDRLKTLQQGDQLYLMRDVQNKANHSALAIRTAEPLDVIGFCPDFLVHDFNRMIDSLGAKDVQLTVVKVNLTAPLQMMLCCELSCDWVAGFEPFDNSDQKAAHHDALNAMAA